eukprot:TRINITY_DN69204_c0_g1_i1.p1 TRINITY_DN69204_c0_g1~~TRINITY_DN69204_c0_g1_i1.p1  ORF type:complete len:609 (-),score=81.90 TRINITY_DN69204_c0_g1_i1:202-2028(-)
MESDTSVARNNKHSDRSADDAVETRWRSFWGTLLARFEEESGDAPEIERLDTWELDLLARLFGESMNATSGSSSVPNAKKCVNSAATARRLLIREAEGPIGPLSLTQCERHLRVLAARSWDSATAAAALAQAVDCERRGHLEDAGEAYARALELGVENAVAVRIRFAQLLRVLGAGHGRGGIVGGIEGCEAELRRAVGQVPNDCANIANGTASRAIQLTEEKRHVVGRLALLLCQEGREAEAFRLLRYGGWSHMVAPWVLRFAKESDEAEAAVHPAVHHVCPSNGSTQAAYTALLSPPLYILDDALPPTMLKHLGEVLAPGAAFWREHGYNEVVGSGENGYFSYLHKLGGKPETSLDLVISRVGELVSSRYPVGEATHAEWWAHCRPHPVGHQLHFDSDDEGIGGARHPICSVVVFVDAPDGFGGPTLVTDQRLGDKSLARKGWLAHPRVGRLVVFDGSVLHGVVPAWGESPAVSSPGARRVTWMVAFWRKISSQAFGEDGLSGSSRPLPDPMAPFVAGPRTYTWHMQLAMDSSGQFQTNLGCFSDSGEAEVAGAARRPPREVVPCPLPGPVWTRVVPENLHNGAFAAASTDDQEDDTIPAYSECFQW